MRQENLKGQAIPMNPLVPISICGVLLLQGCAPLLNHFGYYRYERADHLGQESGTEVRFPSSMDGGTRLSGPMLAALKTAMGEYRPPTVNPKSLKTPEDICLARWENINTTVLQASAELFFVRFSPDIRACAPGLVVIDAGAVYAIDKQGRVLATE